MEYFFIIMYSGLDKNGNSKFRVIGGHKPYTNNSPFVTLNKVTMVSTIGGRWSDKTESITTKQNIEQIKERLDKYYKNNYNYMII